MIDIRQFLGRKCDTRYDLWLPRIQGDKLCACDGKRAVRLDKWDYDGPWPTDQTKPPFSSIFTWNDDGLDWQPVPVVEACSECGDMRYLPEREVQCDECKGTCKVSCSECEGEGEAECDMGHMHECDECGGCGDYDCDVCKRSGVIRDEPLCKCTERRIELLGKTFDASMLRPFTTLPGVQCAIVNYSQLAFRFDGGDGVLMPIQTY